jgi:hypothetical protein
MNAMKTTPQSFRLSSRLEGIGEYYFSSKLREIDELNRQGKSIINLGIAGKIYTSFIAWIPELQRDSRPPGSHVCLVPEELWCST